jgi:hypothetical protein
VASWECIECGLKVKDAVLPVFHTCKPKKRRDCFERMVGTRLKNLISWFPIPNKGGCRSCRSLEAKMNSWGPEMCEKKIDYILKKLAIGAKRRGLPFSRRLVEILVRRAINGG